MAIELKKGQKLSLEKKQSSLGEIIVNLNWDQGKKGFFSSRSNIDLDLGCLYELTNGKIGCVQALGNAFGTLNQEPYISLDGDDRTGANTAGETLRINGNMVTKIKRVLLYTFIYKGVANWQQVNGIVTVKYPGSQDIIVRMDEHNTNQKMCAIAMIENHNNETFSVEKIVNFYAGHEAVDRAFGWGIRWSRGSKD